MLGENSGEQEASDLRGEDGRHGGRANAAHERGGGFFLDQCLRRNDDARAGEADEEAAEDGEEYGYAQVDEWQRESEERGGGEQERSERDATEAEVDLGGVADVFCEGVEGVDAKQQANADRCAGDGEDNGRGVERVAHVDGDERTEAAHDEHAGGESDDDEEQGGVMEDEARADFHVGEDAADFGWLFGGRCGRGWSIGRGSFGHDQCQRCDERARGEEAKGIDSVAGFGAEDTDDGDGDWSADDAENEHDLLHQRIGRAQAMEGDGGANRDALSGTEEAGDDADRGENRIEAVDVMDEEEQQAEARADEVAGDEGDFDGPAIDEDATNDA